MSAPSVLTLEHTSIAGGNDLHFQVSCVEQKHDSSKLTNHDKLYLDLSMHRATDINSEVWGTASDARSSC